MNSHDLRLRKPSCPRADVGDSIDAKLQKLGVSSWEPPPGDWLSKQGITDWAPIESMQNNVAASRPKKEISTGDTITSMARRLTKVERLNKQQAATILKATNEIAALKTELARYKTFPRDEDRVARISELEEESDSLRRQNEEMIQFLGDYGLTWVGYSHEGTFDVDRCRGDVDANVKLYNDSEEAPRNEVDMTIIETRIRDLNAVAESDAKIVQIEQNKYTFSQQEPIPLVFYRDGLCVRDGCFQAYGTPAAQKVIQDLLDGYFPYCLKEDFPEGVLLKSVDKTSTTFKAACAQDPNHVGDFLKRLPERVVKNGQVCEIRSAIEKRLYPVAHAPAPADLSLLRADRLPDTPQCRIAVQCPSGRLEFKFEVDHTVGDVMKAVAAATKLAEDKFDLKAAFSPGEIYSCRSITVEQAGLTPSAKVLLVEK